MEGLKCGTLNCVLEDGQQWDSTDDCCYNPNGNFNFIVLGAKDSWVTAQTIAVSGMTQF